MESAPNPECQFYRQRGGADGGQDPELAGSNQAGPPCGDLHREPVSAADFGAGPGGGDAGAAGASAQRGGGSARCDRPGLRDPLEQSLPGC